MDNLTKCFQLVLVSAALLILFGCGAEAEVPTSTPEPIRSTATSEPVVLEIVTEEVSAEPTPLPTATPIPPTATPEPTETPITIKDSADYARFGVSGAHKYAKIAQDIGLPFTIYMDWKHAREPKMPPNVDYWQMIRLRNDQLNPGVHKIRNLVTDNLGAVWLVGNEPDVIWQDSISAESYATLYHQVYTEIKAIDPTATVSPGGIAQATPLRLQYLDTDLASYEEQFGETLPADMWNIHAYVLREERDSWGIGIPPGMDDVNEGELHEIEDHNDLTIFTDNILRFRQWMADNGYQETPLAITELGILLPHDYGFPPEVIAQYMRDTFDILLTLNNETGYSADNNNLVQHWVWYVVEEDEDSFPFSNLISSKEGTLTFVGEAFRSYLEDPK